MANVPWLSIRRRRAFTFRWLCILRTVAGELTFVYRWTRSRAKPDPSNHSWSMMT